MANYQLRSGSTVLVDVQASSNLDTGGGRTGRRGQVVDTMAGQVMQFMEGTFVGETPIEWDIPLADGRQRAVLQSASVGTYGDELVLSHPRYGNVSVAFVPGRDGYEEEPVGIVDGSKYRIRTRFIRLS